MTHNLWVIMILTWISCCSWWRCCITTSEINFTVAVEVWASSFTDWISPRLLVIFNDSFQWLILMTHFNDSIQPVPVNSISVTISNRIEIHCFSSYRTWIFHLSWISFETLKSCLAWPSTFGGTGRWPSTFEVTGPWPPLFKEQWPSTLDLLTWIVYGKVGFMIYQYWLPSDELPSATSIPPHSSVSDDVIIVSWQSRQFLWSW